MSYHYVWLVWSSVFHVPWLLMFFAFDRHRKHHPYAIGGVGAAAFPSSSPRAVQAPHTERLDIINDPLGRLQYAAMDERLIRPEPKF